MPRLVVLDALGLAYRAYYAFISRPLRNSRGDDGYQLNGLMVQEVIDVPAEGFRAERDEVFADEPNRF